uniref:Uncharacterized protein n=1 Tax=Rangifer tarandus platyrhynchus TaxID=3082113 RepID=A0ACB0FJE8_RANTA|nr:unnamed protein product [Rangifer tarandus platyrhynchus]
MGGEFDEVIVVQTVSPWRALPKVGASESTQITELMRELHKTVHLEHLSRGLTESKEQRQADAGTGDTASAPTGGSTAWSVTSHARLLLEQLLKEEFETARPTRERGV